MSEITESMLEELEYATECFDSCQANEKVLDVRCGCVDSCMMSCADSAF